MRTKRKRRALRLLILMLFIITVLTALLLFRVKKTIISGNERHSASEISSGLMTDFLSQNSLYLIWKYRDGQVPDTLPYLESMKITMQSPYVIAISVAEKQVIGYIDNGDYAYFDASGVVLEITDEILEGIPVITGVNIGEITLYQKLPTESSSQLRTILSLLDLLNYQGLEAKEIRFGSDSEITVYIDMIEAVLGQDEYLEEKIANLRAVLNLMSGAESGTLHLENVTGKNEDITFTPSGQTETETETDSTVPEDDTAEGGADGDSSGSPDNDAVLPDDGDTGTAPADGEDGSASQDEPDSGNESVVIDMVFNSNGQLVYNVHVENGTVVDSNGNAVAGCYVDEEGYIIDAYMNRFDPVTGELVN